MKFTKDEMLELAAGLEKVASKHNFSVIRETDRWTIAVVDNCRPILVMACHPAHAKYPAILRTVDETIAELESARTSHFSAPPKGN